MKRKEKILAYSAGIILLAFTAMIVFGGSCAETVELPETCAEGESLQCETHWDTDDVYSPICSCR